jgi:hypothetical protein
MIAARQIAFGKAAGAKGPSAKDYVQDGLVAMWDVVENISLGESDHSRPYVYNIAPNGPVFTINNVTFDEATMSYSTPSSSSHTKIDPALVNGFVNRNCTVEFLTAEANASANGWGAAAAQTVDGFAYVFVSVGKNSLWVSKDGTQRFDTLDPTDKRHSSIVISGNTMSSYCGGVFDKSATFLSQGYQYVTQFGFLSIPRYNVSRASGMRCFRLYNRALTAEEIAHNYEIDKARFGL